MDVESAKHPIRVSLSSLDAIDPDTFNWNAFTGSYKGTY